MCGNCHKDLASQSLKTGTISCNGISKPDPNGLLTGQH
jgi:hypothetical protein